MLISAIKQQVKNPERASIFIEGKYSFSLSLNELVAEKLKPGQDIDEPRLKALKKLSEEGKLRLKAMNWLLLRPHSVREFRDYLFRKKVDPDFADTLIEEFTTRGYLDDHAFAVWWRDQRSSHNRSDRYIRSELTKKGVSREVVDDVMSSSGGDELERLRTLVAKKRQSARYQDDQKLMQYLARQGFAYDLIKQALRPDDD